MSTSNNVLLNIQNLKTYFYTDYGVVKAVDGINLHIGDGETVGVVGESGCGKSITGLSILRLVPKPPGEIVGGQIFFQGQDLLRLSEKEMRKIRGNKISMIFQEPMTSLNPVFTVGNQVSEAILLHQGLKKKEALEKNYRCIATCRHTPPGRTHQTVPPPDERRHATAGDDCHGHFLQPYPLTCR